MGLCDDHNQPSGNDFRTRQTAQLAQPPPRMIAIYRPANFAGRNNAEPRRLTVLLHAHHADAEETALGGSALFADERKFPTGSQSGRSRKPKPVRLRCDGRNGLQHPSAAGAYVHADDDGSGLRGRFWSSSARGSRTGACAYVCWVDRCASYLKKSKSGIGELGSILPIVKRLKVLMKIILCPDNRPPKTGGRG
ncbi:hypothetical protein TSACC_22138 [Terrimicrobium sacchariphilum]|uniref:Uncharacterized protein n=1 Tax=Terrimicrobium sacchariphilum TaxID=690879 RepID=A0A146G880_TERSA|nr:hypothetical protein TSACC_22138 [Terrimicrobium sacchariphilum]